MQHLVYTAGYVPFTDWQHAQQIAATHNGQVASNDNKPQDDSLHLASLAAMNIRFQDR
jgi:hypothetical protein